MEIIICSNVYAYDSYRIGDKIQFNNEDYYVIDNSNESKNYVTLLKALPLTEYEIDIYNNNVINDSYIAHLTYLRPDTSHANDYDYEFDYDDSYVKTIVDYWAENVINDDDLVFVDGYKARLLDNSDLPNIEFDFYYEQIYNGGGLHFYSFDCRPIDGSSYKEWLNYNNEIMLTAIRYNWFVMHEGVNDGYHLYFYNSSEEQFYANKATRTDIGVVRPVINLKKNSIDGNHSLEKQNFDVGDIIYYNGEKYNVIKNTNSSEDYVVALKWEPLTKTVVNSAISASIGFISYYSSDTCSYSYNNSNVTGCTNDYNSSNVKRIVDNWSNTVFSENDLISVDGFRARIISKSDLINNLGYYITGGYDSYAGDVSLVSSNLTPSFMYDYAQNSQPYWYMSDVETIFLSETVLRSTSFLNVYEYSQIRPVINLNKCSLGDEYCESPLICKEGTTPIRKKIIKYIDFRSGDTVKINNESYYVVKNSDKMTKSLLLMKAEPLTKDIVNQYINNDLYVSEEGEVPYLLNDGCYCIYNNDNIFQSQCYTNKCDFVSYDDSTVKKIVDGWARDNFADGFLQSVDNYMARLISKEDLLNDLHYEQEFYSSDYYSTDATPLTFSNDTDYLRSTWSMSIGENGILIYDGSKIYDKGIFDSFGLIQNSFLRPVIVVDKENIADASYEVDTIVGCLNDEGNIIPIEPIDEEDVVEVDNTLNTLSNLLVIVSLILIIAGLLLISYNFKKSLRDRKS